MDQYDFRLVKGVKETPGDPVREIETIALPVSLLIQNCTSCVPNCPGASLLPGTVDKDGIFIPCIVHPFYTHAIQVTDLSTKVIIPGRTIKVLIDKNRADENITDRFKRWPDHTTWFTMKENGDVYTILKDGSEFYLKKG